MWRIRLMSGSPGSCGRPSWCCCRLRTATPSRISWLSWRNLLSPPPSVAYVPEGDRRRGDLACALASAAGIVLDEWQQLALSAGLDRRGDHWSAFEVGIIVPRQNGKTFLLAIREIAGILLFGERLVIHSAHEWRTVSEQFVATVALIEGSPLRKYLKSVRRTGGEESITFINGGRLRFMNRSRESARGF